MKLEIKDLHKSFNGKEILQSVSFSATSGKGLGLLGRNGAGKTTTLRILLDLFKPDEGSITMDGMPFKPKRYQIGYLPEERGLYPKKTVNDQLIYFAQLRGLSRKKAQTNLNRWFKRMALSDETGKTLESLSKGNQQKIQLIQALMCDPEIIILDEPFSGLDPINAILFEQIIKEAIRDNKIVIFSSHQMNHVEALCEEIVILKEGKTVLKGSIENLKHEFGTHHIRVKASNYTAEEMERMCFETMYDLVSVYDRKEGSLLLELLNGQTKETLLQRLLLQGVEIESFSVYEPSLTDLFILKAGD